MCRSTASGVASVHHTHEVTDQLDPVVIDNPDPSTHKIPNHIPMGDPMSIPKDSHLTRFYFQNPNGISLGHETESVLEHAKRMHCDHLVLPEIKLDTHQRWVRGRLHEHCRRTHGAGQYRSVMTNSTHTYHTAYKPGGLLSVTTGRLTGRILESGSDPMGRWVYTKFSASGANVVTVIGIYQPTAQRVDTARPTTVTAQQFSLLKQRVPLPASQSPQTLQPRLAEVRKRLQAERRTHLHWR